MSFSNTYNFGNTPADELIKEAFERCGTSGELISSIQVKSAIASFNYLLADWVNRGLNLFPIDQQAISMVYEQNTYTFPPGTIDILEGTMVIPTRQFGGTPFSSSGTAANAFDDDLNTSCTQTQINGDIGYAYNSDGYNISYIGISTFVERDYTIVVECSLDNINWIVVSSIPRQTYYKNTPVWAVPAAPRKAPYWRIRETGGAVLDINQIYFDTHYNSRTVSRISRADYMAIPTKFTSIAVPTSFIVYPTTVPTLALWPNPNTSYPLFVYTRTRYVQDVTDMLQSVDSPQRFIEALVAGLAARIALKYYPAKYSLLKDEADKAYGIAALQDVERGIPLKIEFNNFNQ